MSDPGFYDRLRTAAHAAPDVAPPGRWDLTRHEHRVMSQNGEDGVLLELLRLVGARTHEFVEFGAQDGREGTCAFLAQVLGWSGLLIEADDAAHRRLADVYADRPDVRVRHAMVTPATVAELFDGAAVPAEPDVVSIDIDGNDAYVLQVLPRRPRVLVVEYNASLPRDPDVRLVQAYTEAAWDGTQAFGASLGAIEEIARRLGYRLVHTELAGVNAFFVRDDLGLPDGLVPPRRSASYDLRGLAHPPARGDRPFLTLGDEPLPLPPGGA